MGQAVLRVEQWLQYTENDDDDDNEHDFISFLFSCSIEESFDT